MNENGRPVQVAIRVDGGTAIGSGHVTRCLTLAQELRRQGARVAFLCRELEGDLIGRIAALGFFTARLPRIPSAAFDARDDAARCAAILREIRPDWLIVDHYGIDAGWERQQRPHVGHILVIDDLANRQHDCDVLLDQNFYGELTPTRYADRVPASCKLLLGPRYALLAQEYSVLRKHRIPRNAVAQRCLVFFGGTDAANMTAEALRALDTPKLRHLQVDVVVGMNHPARQEITELVRNRPGSRLYGPMPSLAGLMASADVCIGAGGTTTWERLCLGVPTAVVTIADNQELLTQCLDAAGAVKWVGTSDTANSARIAAAVEQLITDQTPGMVDVDGLGTLRVAAAMFRPRADRLHVERATLAHMGLFLDWRNDALSRRMSFDSMPVQPQDHRRWFEGKLSGSRSDMLVGMVGDLPVGQVRLDYADDGAELSYVIEPVVRGLGLGAPLVRAAINAATTVPAGGFRAQVRAENVASRRIFERLGWQAQVHGERFTFTLSAEAAQRQRNELPGGQ